MAYCNEDNFLEENDRNENNRTRNERIKALEQVIINRYELRSKKAEALANTYWR